jgi:hypothetical protein
MERCRIDVTTIRVYPPKELITAAHKRYAKLLVAKRETELPSDRIEIEERTPAIDMPFDGEVFLNVTITKASLHADVGKAFEEAKREIERQTPKK